MWDVQSKIRSRNLPHTPLLLFELRKHVNSDAQSPLVRQVCKAYGPQSGPHSDADNVFNLAFSAGV
jgi:uncharacterized membrane protein YdfJ with MMPL/SSD domain